MVDANDIDQTTKAIEQASKAKGPRVLISRHPCILYEKGVNHNLKIESVQIDTKKCNNCMICIKNFGCPAMTLVNEKVTVVDS